jgi:hypothetical protein
MKNVQLADDVHVFAIKKSSLCQTQWRLCRHRKPADGRQSESRGNLSLSRPTQAPAGRYGKSYLRESEVLEYISALSVQEPTLVIRSKEGEERITMPADVRRSGDLR